MKYFISEPWFAFRELFTNKNEIKNELKELHNNGFLIIKNFLSKEKCNSLITDFKKNLSNEKVWRDDVKSDTRIFGIEKKAPDFDEIFNTYKLKKIYNSYVSSTQKSIILCNHIIPKKENLGSGGGWHRDSMHRRQLKYIVYLNDAKIENGCFQYLPSSHKIIEKLKINLILSKPLGNYRYSQEDIDKLSKSGYKISSLEGNAGDLIIVDTSGIHRGHPISKGERFATTKYMWERKVPSSISELLIN